MDAERYLSINRAEVSCSISLHCWPSAVSQAQPIPPLLNRRPNQAALQEFQWVKSFNTKGQRVKAGGVGEALSSLPTLCSFTPLSLCDESSISYPQKSL